MLTQTRSVPLELALPALDAPRRTATTQTDSTTSFAQQLAVAIEGYLGQSQNGAHLQIDISPQSSQQSGTRQFTVTVTDTPNAATSTAKSTTGTSTTSTSTSTSAAAPSPAPAASIAPITDEADAYWAMQPPQVQILRTIDDLSARVAKGQELAQKGYPIDYDIMIWHQDPYMTMHIREGLGYSWVPGMGQPAVSASPGISFPGMPGYLGGQAPAGAIQVTTDFARGLERTSPWYGPASPPAS